MVQLGQIEVVAIGYPTVVYVVAVKNLVVVADSASATGQTVV